MINCVALKENSYKF